MEPTVRRSIEDAIERLLGLLNVMDGDTDLEPELGFTGNGAGYGSEVTDDREGDDERDCDLAGCCSDLEDDPAYSDMPGHIAGGQGL